MKRDVITKRKASDGFEPPDDPLFLNRPLLAEACADPIFDDGTPREPWGLSLNWIGSSCTASLNDKPQSRSLNSTANSSSDALDMLERLLESPHRPWRHWGTRKRG